MLQFLTDNEKEVLNFYKNEYDKKHSHSFGYVEPKSNRRDTLASLQAKGYLEFNCDDFRYNQEFIRITLKDKFFEYFNININQ